jgi:diguanylate cyclase (GGDEF)-like protein
VGSKLASASQGIGRATVSAMARPRMRVAASAVAAAGLLGATLGVAAWTQPVQRSVSMPAPPAASMTFSYATTVPLTPAYDGTTVTSPAPVFRSVAEGVDVTFAYAGPPGKVAVDAELANATGWHSTIPLAEERSFTGNVYRGVVRLDLDSLEARANAGATAIGVRSSDISVRVVPRVTGATGTTFAPALKLKLTPVALTPDGAFVVKDAAPAPAAALVPQEMSVAGRTVARVSTLRTVSTLLILGAILAAAALFVTIRRTQPATEGERIRRRYRQLLVEVEPIEPPSGRPVFRVTEFKTLARLAERYGLLVLYWSTPPSTTFAVHEDTATYWYCTDAVAAPVPTDPAAQQATAEDVTEAPEHWQISLPDAQDPLTKLGDQSLLVGELQFALDASGGERLCLMLISLDNLPLLSETFGPGGGDAVLVTIAERLRRTVRPRDLVARLGNDDFAVVFDNVGQVEVDSIAKRVMRSVDESIFVQGQQVRVRTSLGVASASPSQDATALMARATTALADAKAAATQHLAWFTETATGQDLE